MDVLAGAHRNTCVQRSGKNAVVYVYYNHMCTYSRAPCAIENALCHYQENPKRGMNWNFSGSPKTRLTTKWREGVHMVPPRLLSFALSFLIDFFRGCREYAPIIRKIIEKWKFAVQIEILQKNTFFALPPPTLGSVAQTTHAWKFCSWQGFWV